MMNEGIDLEYLRRENEIQEAIDLVSFGKTAFLKCGNCGERRSVGLDVDHPYEVAKCWNCGDDLYDLLMQSEAQP